jgi:SAM-dependent methyltransferase
MSDTPDARAVRWYDHHGQQTAAHYDTLDPAQLYAGITPFLPKEPGLILDVGAGSGRDAAWLAGLGHRVIAVEPSRTMREYAAHYHQHSHIEWVNDELPALAQIYRRNYVFDCVFVNAVWMFIPARERARAFRKLVDLLKPGGVLLISVQLGVADDERGKYAVDGAELSQLAIAHGLLIERDVQDVDQLGRAIAWQQLVVRVPDDGTGALPLLRHLILNDRKSATYKLGLLRTMVRIADSAPGMAQLNGDDGQVVLPFGLFGLYWVRLYQPLTHANIPQSAINTQGADGLGFGTAAYRQLPANIAMDLRIGMRFSADTATSVRAAVKDACDLIQKMPAHYITFDDGRQVFHIDRGAAVRMRGDLTIDEAFLWSFGTLTMPRHIWLSMMRFSAWIEPALIWEWQKLSNSYAQSQGRTIAPQILSQAMEWTDPQRVVARARAHIGRLHAQNQPLYCVWSGKRLDPAQIDVDHILPWAAWPCADLWNLVPAARDINQHQKRDRLISATLLDRASERLYDWWTRAYLLDENTLTPQIFYVEAKTSLAVHDHTIAALVHGLHQRRLTLRQDQQISEWQGPR